MLTAVFLVRVKCVEMKMLPMAVLCGLFFATDVLAETKLTLRGGYSSAMSEYPYAYDSNEDLVVGSNFGDGAYGYVALSDSDLFGSFGGELSFTFYRITGDDDYTGPVGDRTFDIIGLSHTLGMDAARTSNTTRFSQIRLLATRELPSTGIEVLGGLGFLDFSSKSYGRMFFATEYSAQRRDSLYSGVGAVFGARKEFALTNATVLRLEGFAGAYTGDRELEIEDAWIFNAGELTRKESQTVYSLDLAASIAVPVRQLVDGGALEIGVGYTKLFNVMDTTNYNTTTRNTHGATGSRSSDVDAFSVFVGLQIPL